MIDPDYAPIQSLFPRLIAAHGRQTAFAQFPNVPYGARVHIQPRLPGKPVQIMPPSPHRQGRRGYDLWIPPNARVSNFINPALATAVLMFLTLSGVGAFTCGLGLLAAPWIAMHFVRWGLLSAGNRRRVTLAQAWWFAFFVAGLAWTPVVLCAQLISSPGILLGTVALGAFTMLGATFEAMKCCMKHEPQIRNSSAELQSAPT